MASRQPVPAPFREWVDLSQDVLGTFVLYATDDYFAAKENLLKPSAPLWLEDEYTDKGKWMDGWESQRKRGPGHDFAIVRLGAAGRVRGVLVDTTHFKGNAPQQVMLDGIEASYTATAEQLLEATDWLPLLPRAEVKPDHPNVFTLDDGPKRITHVRLHIFPDGGVARLRVYGDVVPEARLFWRGGSVDLAAVENGGTIAAESDAFFGPASNMLLPGRGVNMGDGWETKRRRTPGTDWAVVKLARRGVVERVELDTHFFKGNAPQAVTIEALDDTTGAPTGWTVLLDRTPLVQHRRHTLEPARPVPATHVRVHIHPHGGVNRMRLFGHALDGPEERAALERLDGEHFLSFCGSRRWAETMAEARPFPSVRQLFATADAAWWKLDSKDWLEAFAAHPRIGQAKRAETQTAQSAAWSSGEQRSVTTASSHDLARLAELNARYFEKFGFIFIVFASGRSVPELLTLLEERLPRTREEELETAAREQARITRLRIEKWLLERLA